jgi:glycosyltransferase involved in cell wall biosynthesis
MPQAERPLLLVVGPLRNLAGVELFTELLLRSEALQQFDVHHFDTTKPRPKETQGRFDLGNLWWTFRVCVRLAKTLAYLRPSVAYMPVSGTWTGFTRDAVLAWLMKHYGVRTIGHVHGSRIDRVLADAPRRPFVNWALSQWDTLLPLGESIKQLLQAVGYRGELTVVPSTVRPELLEAGQQFQREYQTDGTVHGLFVGQLGRRKGVFVLLKSLAALKAEGVPFDLKLVGTGEFVGDLREVEQASEELGLSDLASFAGLQAEDELYNSYRESDILLLPSFQEGMPAVIHEAGAFGLPVITTPVGAMPDVIEDGVSGVFVEPGDAEGLAQAIKRLVGDAQERERLGKSLSSKVSDFHPDRVSRLVATAVVQTLLRPDPQQALLVAADSIKVPAAGVLLTAPILAFLGLGFIQPQDVPLGTTYQVALSALQVLSNVHR